ncbi:MAG: toxin ParE1/3/4 [Myxococcota bacterium]|jgi:toxin ParE1/3/4
MRLTDLAQDDLESVERWVALDDAAAAIDQVLRVLDAITSLGAYPNLGRVGRVPGTREWAVGGTPDLVNYRVQTNVLWVLRVIHGARHWPLPE